jgi:hypothetical protein
VRGARDAVYEGQVWQASKVTRPGRETLNAGKVIHGELLKLGFEVSQSSVSKYMSKRPEPLS